MLNLTSTTVPLESVHSKEASPLASPMATLNDDSALMIKSITEKAKAADIDPTMFLFAQLLSKQPQTVAPVPQAHDKPESISTAIGKMADGEDIFVFLHRFEFELTAKTVPQHRWITYLPSVLTGSYKEAYYNNVAVCTSYDEMKIVLLNIGGYSVSECLNSFPLKFRIGGHKTMLQWYNHWRYKFQVILDSLPFLVNCPDRVIEDMSNVFATIGILAGMSQEHRDSVLNKHCITNQSFVQECNTWCQTPSHGKPFPPKFHHHKPHEHGAQSDSRHYDHRQSLNHKTPLLNSPTSHSYTSHSHTPHSYTPHSHTNHPRRDLNTVTCYKCNNIGHYANNCPITSISPHSPRQQPHPSQTSSSSNPTPSQQPNPPNRPIPVPRNNNRTVRRIVPTDVDPLPVSSTSDDCLPVHTTSDDSLPVTDSTPLNCYIEDDLVTHGTVNGIPTPVIIDSGAKISLISSDFVDDSLTPVKYRNIFGISQIPHSVPVYEIPVELPTMQGMCQLAVDSRLPSKTVLVGIDFGKENLIKLMDFIKVDPIPVLTVTRAMQSENDLAEQVAEALHTTEGANPLALNDIPDFVEEESDPVTTELETVLDAHAVESNSRSHTSQKTLVPTTIPTLSFDGIGRDQFVVMQKEDPTLAPLWENALTGEKHFFIVDGLLMCMTSTLNTISHALVVPQQLRHKVLLAAHEGLGHGGLNTTRSLINKHFTWWLILESMCNPVRSV